MLTLQQLWADGRQKLMEAQVPDGELDSRLLLLEAFGLSLSEFFLKRNDKYSLSIL